MYVSMHVLVRTGFQTVAAIIFTDVRAATTYLYVSYILIMQFIIMVLAFWKLAFSNIDCTDRVGNLTEACLWLCISVHPSQPIRRQKCNLKHLGNGARLVATNQSPRHAFLVTVNARAAIRDCSHIHLLELLRQMRTYRLDTPLLLLSPRVWGVEMRVRGRLYILYYLDIINVNHEIIFFPSVCPT